MLHTCMTDERGSGFLCNGIRVSKVTFVMGESDKLREKGVTDSRCEIYENFIKFKYGKEKKENDRKSWKGVE